MIISHKHRFIFLHCRKVAGSSLTVYLNTYLGPDDLQVGSWEDTISNGGRYNRRVLNDFISFRGMKYSFRYIVDRLGKNPRFQHANFVNTVNKDLYRGFTGSQPEHPTAAELRNFDPDSWANYFKFCFIRNPYERALSDYRWRIPNTLDSGISFSEFLERLADVKRPDPEGVVPKTVSNWPIYTIDDRIAVDFIGRYENLTADFERVCREIRIPFVPEHIPFAKKGSGKRASGGYREFYGEREKQLVEQLFWNEIETFGYSF